MLRARGEILEDGRWFAAPADRNKDPILEVLARVLPRDGLVLEIGSGTGQHVVHFAKTLTHLTWQPSDPDADFRGSIALWTALEKLPNVHAPLDLDVRRHPWPLARADAVISINMIHVAPWAAAQALIDGAKQVLPGGGLLFLYGPFSRAGRHTSAGNEAFDADLRARNPDWGVRDLESVVRLAGEAGMELSEIVEMPANNLSVVFRKRAPGVAAGDRSDERRFSEGNPVTERKT